MAEYIFYDYDVGRGAHERHGGGDGNGESFAGWRKLDSEKNGTTTTRTESGFSGETKINGHRICDDRNRNRNSNGRDINEARGIDEGDALYNEVQNLLKECITLFYEADDLLKRTDVAGPERSYSSYVVGRKGVEVQVSSSSGFFGPHGSHGNSNHNNNFIKRWITQAYLWVRGMVRRIRYLMKKDEVGEKMARLGEQKQKLGSVQMSLFLRKSAAQDQMLRRAVAGMERILAKEREREKVGERERCEE